jgi:hypothetical protein
MYQWPTDYPRPPEQNLAGFDHTFPLPGEVISAASSWAGDHKVTTFMLLLAAFKVLLYRYSGQSDICVGVPQRKSRSQLGTPINNHYRCGTVLDLMANEGEES